MKVLRSDAAGFAVIAARLVLIAEIAAGLWIALALWMFQLSALDGDGGAYDRFRGAAGPAAVLVWVALCAWAVTASARLRGPGAGRPVVPVVLARAVHLLGAAWAAVHRLWAGVACSLALAALLASAARPALPRRKAGPSGG